MLRSYQIGSILIAVYLLLLIYSRDQAKKEAYTYTTLLKWPSCLNLTVPFIVLLQEDSKEWGTLL